MPHKAYIGLGSNLGDREANLDGAISFLRAHAGIDVVRVSSWIETVPVGGESDQPMFLNGAAELDTDLSPLGLMAVLHDIESQFGRVRLTHDDPRTLDLDLLLYDALVIHGPGLVVPHPRLAERRFALQPLAEIAPHARHPVEKATAAELLARLGDDA